MVTSWSHPDITEGDSFSSSQRLCDLIGAHTFSGLPPHFSSSSSPRSPGAASPPFRGDPARLASPPASKIDSIRRLLSSASVAMGNCLKSPTADDVSLLRDGNNGSSSGDDGQQQQQQQQLQQQQQQQQQQQHQAQVLHSGAAGGGGGGNERGAQVSDFYAEKIHILNCLVN